MFGNNNNKKNSIQLRKKRYSTVFHRKKTIIRKIQLYSRAILEKNDRDSPMLWIELHSEQSSNSKWYRCGNRPSIYTQLRTSAINSAPVARKLMSICHIVMNIPKNEKKKNHTGYCTQFSSYFMFCTVELYATLTSICFHVVFYLVVTIIRRPTIL